MHNSSRTLRGTEARSSSSGQNKAKPESIMQAQALFSASVVRASPTPSGGGAGGGRQIARRNLLAKNDVSASSARFFSRQHRGSSAAARASSSASDDQPGGVDSNGDEENFEEKEAPGGEGNSSGSSSSTDKLRYGKTSESEAEAFMSQWKKPKKAAKPDAAATAAATAAADENAEEQPGGDDATASDDDVEAAANAAMDREKKKGLQKESPETRAVREKLVQWKKDVAADPDPRADAVNPYVVVQPENAEIYGMTAEEYAKYEKENLLSSVNGDFVPTTLSNDDVAPAIEGDWRDFRAMLVSQEAGATTPPGWGYTRRVGSS
jgi:hypothetical protein